MNEKVEKLLSKKTMSLMVAIVLLIAGILFCISPAIGEQSVGIVIGIGVLLVGVITGVKDYLVEKELISRGVIVGSIIAAFGIYFMADGGIVSKIIGVIPYILIVTGACVAADGILLKAVRSPEKTKEFVIELGIGVLAVVLGILILTVPFFRKALAVVIGALLIAGSAYFLIGMFKKPQAQNEEKTTESEKSAKQDRSPKDAPSDEAEKPAKSKTKSK